jgi:high-affinity Fe2+/Pb2+ permease
MADAQDRQPDDRRRTRVMCKPWAVAAMACVAAYGLVWALGAGQFRSEFLGASLALGVIGGILLVAFRAFHGPIWLRWLGVFCLNWLFAAYAISFLAV